MKLTRLFTGSQIRVHGKMRGYYSNLTTQHAAGEIEAHKQENTRSCQKSIWFVVGSLRHSRSAKLCNDVGEGNGQTGERGGERTVCVCVCWGGGRESISGKRACFCHASEEHNPGYSG